MLMAMSLELTIYGQLYSKNNSRTFSVRGAVPRSIKNPKALLFEQAAAYQIPGQLPKGWEPMTGPIHLEATIYYPSNRQDLDDTLLMDVLEKAGVYLNDRQVVQKLLHKKIDKENPRVVCKVLELFKIKP